MANEIHAALEDMGFYGTISRFITLDCLPHRDFPLGTNSICLYMLSFLMLALGESGQILKAFGIFSCGIACLSFILFMSTFIKNKAAIFLGTALSFTLLCTPYFQLGGGRNFLFFSMAMYFLSIYVFRKYKDKLGHLNAGILLSLFVLSNESFAPVFLVTALHWLYQMFRAKSSMGNYVYLSLGIASPLALFLGDMALHSQLTNYFTDMITMGAGSRLNASLIDRLLSNSKFWDYGFYTFWGWAAIGFLLCLIGPYQKDSFCGDRESFISLNFVYVPLLAAWVFLGSATREYHIQIALPILATITIMGVINIFKYIIAARRDPFHFGLLVIWPPLVLAPLALLGTYHMYQATIQATNEHMQVISESQEMAYMTHSETGDILLACNEASFRSAHRLNNVHYETISTFSQYPLLLALKNINFPRPGPFLADLSLPGNSGGLVNFDAYHKALDELPTDVLILKSTGGYSSFHDPFFAMCDRNFSIVAEFSGAWSHWQANHTDRIYFSKKFINKNFHESKRITINCNEIGDTNVAISPPILIRDDTSFGLLSVQMANDAQIMALTLKQGSARFLYTADQQTTKSYYLLVNLTYPVELLMKSPGKQIECAWLEQNIERGKK